jgi:hypothetical protein
MVAKYARGRGKSRGKVTGGAGLDAQKGVIAGGLYAGIKVNAPKRAYLLAACSTPT